MTIFFEPVFSGVDSLIVAVREELGNLREYDEAGQVINPSCDDALARALANRLYERRGVRQVAGGR